MISMNKDLFLKSIAETGYNVGFGGRKHWATYDIVDKVPGFIGFGSMAFGIFALIYDELSAKYLSAALLVIGLIGLYVSFYDHKKGDYERSANKLTTLYNDLRDLYREVKGGVDVLDSHVDRLKVIEGEYYNNCISKQVLFSDWYAHYKFFWQYQIDWVEEQKNFRLFRDKIPLSLMFWVFLVVVFLVVFYVRDATWLISCLIRHVV